MRAGFHLQGIVVNGDRHGRSPSRFARGRTIRIAMTYLGSRFSLLGSRFTNYQSPITIHSITSYNQSVIVLLFQGE